MKDLVFNLQTFWLFSLTFIDNIRKKILEFSYLPIKKNHESKYLENYVIYRLYEVKL